MSKKIDDVLKLAREIDRTERRLRDLKDDLMVLFKANGGG